MTVCCTGRSDLLPVPGGSDYFIEVLSQNLEFVYQQTNRPADQQPRKRLPSHLVVVAD